MTKLWPVPLLLLCVACSSPEPPAPPKFIDTDPCSLLRQGDIDGQLPAPAKSGTTCTYVFGETLVTVALLNQQFDQASARLQSDGGYGAVVDDHVMTLRCKDSAGSMTCEAVVEVRAGEVLGLTVLRDGAEPTALGQTTETVAHKALGRLPK